MKPMKIRRFALGTLAAGLIATATLSAAAPATAAPGTVDTVAVSQAPAQFDYSDGVLSGEDSNGFRHTFTEEETQQIFDAAKAGGIMAATLTCLGFTGGSGAAFCGPASEVVVGLIAKQFEPNGRCLQVWMTKPGGEETLPIGGKYVECPPE